LSKKNIINSWPSYSISESNLISKTLLSNKVNYWTGNQTKKFENEFAKVIGSKYAIAVANGSLALELALRSLGLGSGDEVIVTSRTFVASASSISNIGADPIFVDVDPNSGNISPKEILKALTTKTKAIICVHLAGWPCDMDSIMKIAYQNGIKVIEDCAQAHGAKYKGKYVGSIGDIGTWSFCQDKIISTGGEGGMVTTNDNSLWKKMWSYKDHGKNHSIIFDGNQDQVGFKWVHDSIGTNFRMIEIQAALGRFQLKKLNRWVKQRNKNAQAIFKILSKYESIRIPDFKCSDTCKKDCHKAQGCLHAFYKCYVYVDQNFLKSNWSRNKIIEEINKKNIPCYAGSCSEIYLEKAFEGYKKKPKERLFFAKLLGDSSLMFLVHPSISKENMNLCLSVIENVILRATIKK